MQAENILEYLEGKRNVINNRLPEYIHHLTCPPILKEAMLYSLEAGGKRLRPILTLATVEAFGYSEERAISTACAIEIVHTYSLIHDDLPAMDDDDLRRGKPTNHKMFGQANAILAGDALNTYAFEIIAKTDSPDVSSEMKLELIKELAQAIGPEGMVGGQVADLQGENSSLTLSELEYIHLHKTGKLLMYSVLAGAILSNAPSEEQQHLKKFAEHLGIAFQIRDDILDIEGDEQLIGKPVGSDTNKEKSTYPKLLTLDGAKDKLQKHVQLSKEYLNMCSLQGDKLQKITDYIMKRDH